MTAAATFLLQARAPSPAPPRDAVERAWQRGQDHLAAGRYALARNELTDAEAQAWRRRDPSALARIYLPLLEACRQLRARACDGPIVIAPPLVASADPRAIRRLLRAWSGRQSATDASPRVGTLVIGGRAAARLRPTLRTLSYRVPGGEVLELVAHTDQTRLVAPADPRWAAGLPVVWTNDPTRLVEPAGTAFAEWGHLTIPLPRPTGPDAGLCICAPGTLRHALARESLLEAWEALALGWLRRHGAQPDAAAHADHKGRAWLWNQMALWRCVRAIDPAAEPVLMELLAQAERLQRF
jgi:hypothetical protein